VRDALAKVLRFYVVYFECVCWSWMELCVIVMLIKDASDVSNYWEENAFSFSFGIPVFVLDMPRVLNTHCPV